MLLLGCLGTSRERDCEMTVDKEKLHDLALRVVGEA